MSMGYSLRKVVLKSALPGIVTGVLIALAIASGETAPLIYTAGFSNAVPHNLIHSRASPISRTRSSPSTTSPVMRPTTWPTTPR